MVSFKPKLISFAVFSILASTLLGAYVGLESSGTEELLKPGIVLPIPNGDINAEDRLEKFTKLEGDRWLHVSNDQIDKIQLLDRTGDAYFTRTELKDLLSKDRCKDLLAVAYFGMSEEAKAELQPFIRSLGYRRVLVWSSTSCCIWIITDELNEQVPAAPNWLKSMAPNRPMNAIVEEKRSRENQAGSGVLVYTTKDIHSGDRITRDTIKERSVPYREVYKHKRTDYHAVESAGEIVDYFARYDLFKGQCVSWSDIR